MALIEIEAAPADIKPPVADGSMPTFTGGKCGFGASAPLLTRTPMHFLEAFKRDLAIIPKLVKLVGPLSTLAEEPFPGFARFASPSVRL